MTACNGLSSVLSSGSKQDILSSLDKEHFATSLKLKRPEQMGQQARQPSDLVFPLKLKKRAKSLL